jgi:hypothetical protein
VITREFISSRMIVDARLMRTLPRHSGHGISRAVFGHISFRDRPQLIRKLPCRLATLYHFLGVCVERIIDDPLGSVELMIVLVAEMPETFG